ncbi:MAG TPA: hypothetical protein VL371_05965, partial [Gemmataceae bacterium]|nr:hypothetical protein [Gemmataceae bacterium]
AGFVDLLEQPADSRVLVEEIGGGRMLTLPRKSFGRRGAVLTIQGDRLRVQTRGGTADQEWARRQLSDIRVARMIDADGPDTFEVLIEPHPGEGARVRLPLGGEAEARWLATTLRRGLRMTDAASGEATPFLERVEQPAGSRIIQEPLSNGVNLIVPPAGYRHPSVRPYFVCGLGYLTIALAAGGVLCALPALGQLDDGLRGLLGVLWLLPVLFGIGAAAAAEEVVRRARRHATLAVVGETLLIEQTNLYGTRQREWRRSRITDIRVGDNLEGRATGPRTRRAVLDRTDPTWELHIHLLGGEIVRLLDGYGDAELQWLATALRRTLLMPASEAPA